MEDMQKRILVTLIVGILLIVGFYFITDAITKYTGFFVVEEAKDSDFTHCLEEQDITIYTNTKDLAKTLSETKLLSYLQYFKIVNCAVDNSECVDNGIDFSNENINWMLNNKKINKDISFEELSEYSGCKLKIN